jgi:hypothetical protein
MLIEPAIHALAPPASFDEDALDPPEQAVAPVAPFVRHQQAADNPFLLGRDHIEAERRPLQQSENASIDPFGNQRLAFGLQRHGLVEAGDCSGVHRPGLADRQPAGRHRRRHRPQSMALRAGWFWLIRRAPGRKRCMILGMFDRSL